VVRRGASSEAACRQRRPEAFNDHEPLWRERLAVGRQSVPRFTKEAATPPEIIWPEGGAYKTPR
jgi:hypothetical protein